MVLGINITLNQYNVLFFMYFFIVFYYLFKKVSLARHEDCENAPYAEHSSVQVINEEDAVRAIYECEEGYELSGSRELICDVDTDLWDVEPPKCAKGLYNKHFFIHLYILYICNIRTYLGQNVSDTHTREGQ